MKYNLYILFLLIAHSLLGQVFPVQVTPQLIPPYSLTIPEYTNANREQLILNLLLTDISELNRAVTLRFSLTSTAGFSVESAPVIIGALPINLSGGVPLRLTNTDLQPYFEFQNLAGISPDVYGRPLPDGLYQFCFEVFDGLSGQQISRKSCATAFLVLNDPPFLNTPSKGEIIAEQNPQNIIFQWTPRHLNATNVEYEFTLVELWDELQDPQTSFLAGMPYYQTTTRATTLLYGPGEPGLLANENYAWRVRAIVSDGISQASIFKNEGYSEIYYFEYNGECLPPQFAITTPKTKNTQTVQWQGGSYLEYNLQYRKKDGASNEWFDVSAFNEQTNIINLEENTTYEYRVGAQCRINGGFSYGNINEFTTAESNAEAGGYECGILPDIQITNQEPLPRLGVNAVFTAGDFPVTVKAVTSSNASTGNYSGVGYITVPYLADTRIAVVFENVKLNSDYQLIDGIVETDYDPDNLDNLSSVDELEEVFEGDNDVRLIEIGFHITIDDIKINDNGSVTVTDPEGGEQRTYAAGDDITIQDESGDMFHVDKEGNITEGGQAAPGGGVDKENTPNVDSNGNITQLSAKGIKVTFIVDENYKYGFDEVPSGEESYLSSHYTETKDTDGNPYKIIHKAIVNGSDDKLKAEVEITDDAIKNTDLVIKTANGQNIEYSISGTTITLDLNGYYAYENEDVYATIQPSSVNEEEVEDSDNDSAETEQEQTIAGVFKLWHLTNKVVNVAIIPAKGVSLPGESALKEQVNQIFGKAAVTINLNIASEFEVSPSLYGNDGTLLMGESGVFENYTDEQRAVINDYKSKNNTSLENYYLFAMGSNIQPSRSGVAGFMPVSRQFGFVFTENTSGQEEGKSSIAGTIAHELGHGAFGLEHPFKEYGTTEGATNWLLDYGNGTGLSHMDWKQIHNPAFKLYFFQDDEDGEYETDGHYSTVYLVSLMLGMDAKKAYELAVATEAPDTDIHNETTFELDDSWADADSQEAVHSLTGGFHGVEEFLSTIQFLATPNDQMGKLGELLHRFGDSYAHTKLDNIKPKTLLEYNLHENEDNISLVLDSWKGKGGEALSNKIEPWISFFNYYFREYGMNFLTNTTLQKEIFKGKSLKETLGFIYLIKTTDTFIMYGGEKNIFGLTADHAFSDGLTPDMIYVRPEWYLDYVKNLAWLIAKKYNLNVNSFDISVFEKMTNFSVKYSCSLKGIIDYEIAKKQNKTTFYIPVFYSNPYRLPASYDALINSDYYQTAVDVVEKTKLYINEEQINKIISEKAIKDYNVKFNFSTGFFNTRAFELKFSKK